MLYANHRIPATSDEAIAPESSALLLWDLQNGLGGKALHLDQLMVKWRVLREAARQAGVLVVCSRHVATAHELMPDTEIWRLMRKQHVQCPGDLSPYMQRGSKDCDFLPGFEPLAGEFVVEKTTPSLFIGTNAEIALRAVGIRAIVLAGVATNIGIDLTARHALALGFFPVVVEDGVGAYTENAQVRGLASLSDFAFVTSAAAVIERWADA